MCRIGALPADELEQQHTQSIDVDGRRREVAVDLLGRRIFRGVDALLKHGGNGDAARLDQLCDPEVEQLDLTRGGYQHIGGFQIAMHDQSPVGISHGIADLQQQTQAGRNIQTCRIAVSADVLTFDIFHGQKWLTARAQTTIQQAGDVGVLQASQDLAFAGQSRHQFARVQPVPHQFQRGLLDKSSRHPLGKVDRTHAAFGQYPFQLPGAEALTTATVCELLSIIGQHIRHTLQYVDGFGVPRVCFEHRQHLLAKHVVSTFARQPRCPLRLRHFDDLLKVGADALPLLWTHPASPVLMMGIARGSDYSATHIHGWPQSLSKPSRNKLPASTR
ncbi:MAG: hypothetical protein BWZ07_02411 [Alphaproteobacteria bacterium ADurb.BinA280]|nr:MAG: hypothetical protein BWZ07_02411 [Alphaproteobacteria bacterium ADurb.BinA280]